METTEEVLVRVPRVLKVYLVEDVSDDEALDLVDRLCDHKKKWQFWKKDSFCKFYCATVTT